MFMLNENSLLPQSFHNFFLDSMKFSIIVLDGVDFCPLLCRTKIKQLSVIRIVLQFLTRLTHF